MKFSSLAFVLISATVAITAHAHSDHAPPPKAADCKAEICTKDEISTGAPLKIIPLMIASGKLEASWKDLKADTVEQKTFKSQTEWVVTVKNDKIIDKAKQTLYIFVTMAGVLSGANFSGN